MKNRHGDNKENTPKSQKPKQKTASQRISSDASSVWIDSAKLDDEVFTKSPDYSRSRTGRKIYTSYNGKELRSQIIPSRRSANEHIEKDRNPIGKLEKKETRLEYPIIENIASIANISRVIDTKNTNDSSKHKEEGIRERDVLPLNSESVLRVDIPLTIENVNLLTSATLSSVKMSPRQVSRLIKEKVESNDIAGSNTKKSKQSDRSKSRGISNANNLETVTSGSIPRRSSSRFADTANMGTNGRSSSARRRSNAKNINSRNQSVHKLRDTNMTEARNNDRNKNVDTNSETNANEQTKTRRNLSNNEHKSEEKRRPKNNRKLKETKIDKQNARAQSGSWSRTVSNLDIITTIPKATIAETTTVSSLDTKIATLSSLSTTIKSSTTARVFSSTEQTSRSKEKNRKEDSRMKKPPKEDFFNHGLGFRGRKISIEESSSTIADLRTTTSKSETQLHGNPGWTLRRRPNYVSHDTPSTTSASVNQNQTNEIILPNNLSKSTEVPLSNAKVLRRGTKRPKAKDENNTVSSVAPKNVTRGSKTFNKSEGFGLPKRIELEESDNYPLAFRDRLSQLKNSNLKLTGEKSTTRTSLQDTTTTTIAQGTAIGSRIIQSKQPTETTITSILTTSSEFPAIDTTTILSSSIEPMTDTATTTSTSTITTTTLQTTSTKPSSRADLATTARSMPETTTPAIDINENLISTETTTIDTQSTVVGSIESEELMTTTTITSPVMSMPTATTISPTTQSTTSDRVMSRPPFTSFDVPNMGSYLGSFDGNQATMPASRFSSSSKVPIRDYQVYGIYPNKTIVRKRPEDNLIDARNINSPYVIFGIFPDGRLVRKFPNGTIIPDSPRNPVEVVFTLSTTTTTNRPASRPYYNQVNQAGTYNQYQSPLYYSNPVYYSKPMDKLKGGIQSPSPVDFGFTDNAIGVPSGVGPKFATSFGPPASTPCANKMSNVLLNRNEYTRMNTLPNVASMFGKLQGPIGSSIIGDYENSEASRTKVASNQRNSVYIGQDKFINYQIDSAPDINPKVVDVKINSVATFMNEGVASSMTSIPSFENLLSNQSGGDIVTTPSGFPWRDPLDQIFGITTNSPIQTASVTSNQLNETAENNVPIMARPINPLVEVFTPVISGVTSTNPENKPTTVSISSITTTTPIITTIPITTTTPIIITTPIPTTAATTTTTTTTTAAITTSTTTTAATTTTTTSTTTTPTTTTIGQTTSSTSIIPRLATTTSSLNVNTLSDVTLHSNTVPSSPTATISADNILNGLQMNTKENVFGTTFEDLTFLNSLLQNNNVKTTSKTLNDIEQMLANRILALAKPGPTRSPKAIKTISSNSILNAIKDFPSSESSSEPIIIDLLPSSSTLSPGISSSASTTKKYPEVRTTALVQSSTVPITRTKAPVVITAKSKTTIQPKTTTQASIGFASLWRALFDSNRFEASTIASAKKNPKSVTPRSVQATQKSIEITPKPVQIIKSTTHTSHIMSAIRSHATPRSVDISDIQLISTKSHADNIDSTSASTLSPISTQRTLLNNPNPRLNDVPTSTYSSEDDSKFLVALLRAIQTETKTSTSTMTPKIIEDEEAFLRAILNNQASISTAIPSSTELNPAALLALLLKQQGIEPSTPAIKFREQLQLAGLDLTTTRSMTTTTNRATFSSSTQSAVSTRKTTTTPRQSLRPSERTSGYTWSPSSTYPPPLFGENSGSGLITATRAIGQFLGAAITGAAQQLQSFLRNGTRSIAG